MASMTQLKTSVSPALDGMVADVEQLTELSTRVARLTAEIGSLRRQRQTASAFERFRGALLSHYATPPCTPPATCRLEAQNFTEAAEGIYFLEFAPSGTGFHWTGPDPVSRFTLFVDRSVPVQVRLSLFSRGRLSERDTMTAEIDGMSYPLAQTGQSGEFVAGPVPPRAGERHTEIALEVPVLFSPDAGSGDSRRLGVAITAIALEPAP